jgi:hypothetical protein
MKNEEEKEVVHSMTQMTTDTKSLEMKFATEDTEATERLCRISLGVLGDLCG